MTMLATAAEAATDRRTLGPAWHRRVEGIHVLKVKGSFYEMGHQHGVLLADAIARGALPYYRTFVKRVAGPTAGGLLATMLPRLLGRRLARRMPEFVHETLRGLSDGSGLPRNVVMEGCTMPDALLWVVARFIQLRRCGSALPYRATLGLGCTSAIAWGDATTDGRMLHARNFDYHGVSCWPSGSAVIFHEPDVGQRYVAVASAGIPLGGATAMNEAGLTLTVHQHMFTDGTRLGGIPIGIVGDIVMRKAESLDDAERILAEHRPVGCWTYLVTDGRRREMLCHEENPDRRAASRMKGAGGTFGYANVYLDPELGRTERNLYGSYWRHNTGRHRKVNALLQDLRGRLDPAAMAGIIGDRGDARCRFRDAIAMVLTVGSVVFRPEDGAVWVGSGPAPTSRGTFVPFRLDAEDHAPDLAELRADDGESDAAREAFACLRRAYVAYLDEGDLDATRRELHRARELQPSEPVLHAVAGILALQAGDAPSAEQALDRAIQLGHPDEERVAAFHLWRARARDLAGRRADARADYATALGRKSDPPARRAALRGQRRPFTPRRARHIHVDLALGDVINP